jgi:hypothetical protein
MIEDRLKETLDRVAGGGPDEAGAFDRFLRHRVRRSRRVAAATALCLFLVLVLAVVLLEPRRSSDDAATPAALGTAEEAHWTPGPLVAAVPLQGFEIHVPTGWEVNRTWQGFELRPISEELRRELPTPIQVGTFALDPADHPQGAELFQDHNEFLGDISGTIGEYNARTSGSFHDGRWWLRTDGGAPGHRTTSWYTPWPYHCQGGEPCPDVLALRTLRVVLLDAGDRVWAQAMELAPTLLRTARPVTNAVPGGAHAPRPACVDAATARPFVTFSPYGRPSRTVQIVWRFSTVSALIPCHLRRQLELSFLEDGRPVAVTGGDKRVLDGNLPEGMALAPGVLGMEWRWTNWCGGEVQVRFGGALVSDALPPSGDVLSPSTRPACVDPSRPSRLKIVEWGE